MSGLESTRAHELSAAWSRVVAEVVQSCERHGRNSDEVTIIAVTKGFPASDIRMLADLGVTDIGESRDQEAAQKHFELHTLGLRWHCIGQVQTNKVRSIVEWADVIHSVDRLRLVHRLGELMPDGRTMDVLIQVSLNTDPDGQVAVGNSTVPEMDIGERRPILQDGRGGVGRAEVSELVAAVVAESRLRLVGIMSVAPLGVEPGGYFTNVARLLANIRATVSSANMFSAGMSGDFDAAIAAGATHLRIGSAILGSRL